MTTLSIFRILFPDFFLVVLGALLVYLTPLDRKLWAGVERLTYYVLFPVLLFDTCSQSQISFSASLYFLLVSFGALTLGILLAFSLAELPFNPKHWASGAQVAFRFNTYVALTVSERLLGGYGIGLMAVLVSIAVPICNFAAVTALSRHSSKSLGLELLKNPLIIATVSGLIANYFDWQIPQLFSPSVIHIKESAITLGLMSVGAGLTFQGLTNSPLLTVTLMSIRHLLIPAAAIVLAILFKLPTDQAMIAVLFCALPTASSAYILAARMGGAAEYVAGLVTLSTILGALSIPFALSILHKFI